MKSSYTKALHPAVSAVLAPKTYNICQGAKNNIFERRKIISTLEKHHFVFLEKAIKLVKIAKKRVRILTLAILFLTLIVHTSQNQ